MLSKKFSIIFSILGILASTHNYADETVVTKKGAAPSSGTGVGIDPTFFFKRDFWDRLFGGGGNPPSMTGDQLKIICRHPVKGIVCVDASAEYWQKRMDEAQAESDARAARIKNDPSIWPAHLTANRVGNIGNTAQ